MNAYTTKILLVLLLAVLVVPASAATLSFSQFGTNVTVDGNPLGGGTGYSDIKTTGDCTATTASELIACLAGATSGQVVYVPETAEINMTDVAVISIPEGVTLASNRGSSGSAGGRIFKIVGGSGNWAMINQTGNNVRVTGLRIEGPYKTQSGPLVEKTGIQNRNFTGLVVDNCELFGWSHAAIYTYILNTTILATALDDTEIGSSITNIHHNYIHHNQVSGEGYGIALRNGSYLAKGNAFAYNRHSTASSGYINSGYEASYNLNIIYALDASNHIFDVHGYPSEGGIAGSVLKFHHNTVISNAYNPRTLDVQGTPGQYANIEWNIMTNSTNDAPNNAAVRQGYGATENITMQYNYIDGRYVAGDEVKHDA